MHFQLFILHLKSTHTCVLSTLSRTDAQAQILDERRLSAYRLHTSSRHPPVVRGHLRVAFCALHVIVDAMRPPVLHSFGDHDPGRCRHRHDRLLNLFLSMLHI